MAKSYDHTVGNLNLTIQEYVRFGLGSKGFSEEWNKVVNRRLGFLKSGLMAAEKARFLFDSHKSTEL